MTAFKTPLILASVGLLLGSSGLGWAGELKVTGAASVGNTIVLPNKAALEAASGLNLTVIVNGDGNGFKDLYAGRSDVMMVAAPLKATEASINSTAPGSVSAADFQMIQVGAISLRFIVNPANPVKSLTEAQLREILTGKITSWQQVGGNDQPIMVVAEMPGFGTRTNVEMVLLDGAPITGNARTLQALVQVAKVVAQAPNAIGYGNAASISEAVSVLPDLEVKQVIGFATKGSPTADARRLIDAAAKYAAAVK